MSPILSPRNIIVVILFLLSGCIPATFTLVPEISGRVIDESGLPISGASIHLCKVNGFGGSLDEKLTSDDAGRFFREEQAKWGLFIVPMDPFGSFFQAVATAEGQQSEIYEIKYPWSKVRFMGIGSKDSMDIGDLQIKKASRQPEISQE